MGTVETKHNGEEFKTADDIKWLFLLVGKPTSLEREYFAK